MVILSMQIIQPTKDQLNKFILAHHGSFQQSWQWGELQERMGRPVKRLLDENCAATFIRHDLKFGRYYWMCPKGPVGNVQIPMTNVQKELGGIFIRIEPQIPYSSFPIHHSLLHKAPKDHNPPATVIVDLTKPEDELLAAMHGKTRYNIRLAAKQLSGNVHIPMTNVQEFWGLLQKTAKRDKFFLHPQKYYELLAEMPEIKLFGVEHKGELIAAAMVSFWGDTATYLHGASDYERRALMAPYLLHWEIIRQAKGWGVNYYDLGGVAPRDEPNHFLAGVTRFKSGWGGEYRENAGSWDYVLDKVWYQIYKVARRVM